MPDNRVARLEDLPSDRGMPCTVEGKAVALFRIGEQVHAVGRWCPHQFADLCDGWVEDGYVVCSHHLWCFSVTDGAMPSGDLIRLPVHEARVDDDGWVRVTVLGDEMGRSADGT